MLELAKQLQPLTRERGIVFVSTDGGTSGGQGAAYFAAHSPLAPRIEAAVVLDSVSAPQGSPIRIVSGRTPLAAPRRRCFAPPEA